MNKKTHYKRRITVLIKEGKPFEQEKWMIPVGKTASCEYWFNKIMTLVQQITAIDSFFYNEAQRIIEGSKRQGGIFCNNVQMMFGFLRHLHEAIDKDQLTKIENEITAADFNNFLEHAIYYCDRNKKVESSVIASAILEDSIKKVAIRNGITKTSKLDSTISALQTNNVISSLQAKKLRYYAGIRNKALHADWDEFALDDVKDLIQGISKLIENYLK